MYTDLARTDRLLADLGQMLCGLAGLDDGSSVVVSRTQRDALFSRWRGR